MGGEPTEPGQNVRISAVSRPCGRGADVGKCYRVIGRHCHAHVGGEPTEDIDHAERFPALAAPARDDSDRLSPLDPTLRERIRDALDVERQDEGVVLLTLTTRATTWTGSARGDDQGDDHGRDRLTLQRCPRSPTSTSGEAPTPVGGTPFKLESPPCSPPRPHARGRDTRRNHRDDHAATTEHLRQSRAPPHGRRMTGERST